MTSDDESEESLDNIDDLINSNLGILKTEDAIYLEEFLVGEDFGSRSPNLWSALRGDSVRDASPGSATGQEEDCQTDRHEESSETIDDPQMSTETASSDNYTPGISLEHKQPRTTKGIAGNKFVSYEAFPRFKDRPFQCELCGLRLSTRESRKRHIIAKHVKEKNHVCNVCGKAFVFKFSLRAHEGIHAPVPRFTCVCGQSFSVRSSYMSHVRRIHRAVSEMKYSCDICSKSFVDHHTLRLHLISVHKPKTIACLHSSCNKMFSTIALMKSHYWYHLKQRFPCDECGQTFSTESYMYKHRRTHAGIRPCTCLECGKTYLSVSHLNKHRRTAHSSVKPFQCSFCGKCYKIKEQMTFHESSHRGEKPFQCEVCGYATAYKNTYYAHRKKHHSQSSANTTEKRKKSDLQDESKTNGGRKSDKSKFKEQLLSSSKDKPNLTLVDTHSVRNGASPSVLQISTTSESVTELDTAKSVSPTATSVDFICVLQPENCTNLPTSFSLNIDNPCKDIQSPSNANFVSSEPLGLLNPASVTSEMIYTETQSNATPELITNYAMPKENLKDNNSEEQSCIILSSGTKCSFPMCDSDESLMLFKIDEDSYIALCAHHSLTNLACDTLREGTSSKEILSVNVKSNYLNSISPQDNAVQPDTSEPVLLEVNEEANFSIDHHQTPAGPCTKRIPEDSSLVQVMSHSTSTVPEVCSTGGRVPQQLDDVKMKHHPEVYLTGNLSAMMELEPGIVNVSNITSGSGIVGGSGPIVDESFGLARVEAHCPLCEEQFHCMDDYVIHLESCHN